MSPIPAGPAAPTEPAITKLAAAYGGVQSTVNRVVLHSAECDCYVGAAAMIDGFFAEPASAGGPGTSAHYAVDPGTATHSVPEGHVAYHAPPNGESIGIEHAGRAAFTATQWAAHQDMLDLSVELCAGICARWGIPARFLTAADLKADSAAKGITTHAQVTAAFGLSTHTDPGLNFPITEYVAAVAAKLTPAAASTTAGEDNPVQFVVIEAPGRSPAFYTTDGVGHPMGSGGWTFINRFAKKHPDLVIFDKTWTAVEYDLVVRKAA